MKKLLLIFSVFACMVAVPVVFAAADDLEDRMKTAGEEYLRKITDSADKNKISVEKKNAALETAKEEINATNSALKAAQAGEGSENKNGENDTSDPNNDTSDPNAAAAEADASQSDAEKLKALRDNATATNRTNMIDKVITGVSTAAIGLGGMQLAQGLAEQSADKAAANEMKAYLSSFRCQYGLHSAKGGETEIQLPGDSTELELLREEYRNKALALKNLKEQLEIKPGIESELVLDETGLYRNEGVNKAESSFGRLSAALQDETGEGRDAQMLADQQKTSKNRVTGGAIAVAGGVATAVGGHMLLDKFGAKDKSAEINKGEEKPAEPNVDEIGEAETPMPPATVPATLETIPTTVGPPPPPVAPGNNNTSQENDKKAVYSYFTPPQRDDKTWHSKNCNISNIRCTYVEMDGCEDCADLDNLDDSMQSECRRCDNQMDQCLDEKAGFCKKLSEKLERQEELVFVPSKSTTPVSSVAEKLQKVEIVIPAIGGNEKNEEKKENKKEIKKAKDMRIVDSPDNEDIFLDDNPMA